MNQLNWIIITIGLFFVVNIVGFNSSSVSQNSYKCERPCGNYCCSEPSDGKYLLNTFCTNPNEVGECGIACGEFKYEVADLQRFEGAKCNDFINICIQNNPYSCVLARIIAKGPSISLEERAGDAIIAASPNVCFALFGTYRCYWNEGREVTVSLVKEVLS